MGGPACASSPLPTEKRAYSPGREPRAAPGPALCAAVQVAPARGCSTRVRISAPGRGLFPRGHRGDPRAPRAVYLFLSSFKKENCLWCFPPCRKLLLVIFKEKTSLLFLRFVLFEKIRHHFQTIKFLLLFMLLLFCSYLCVRSACKFCCDVSVAVGHPFLSSSRIS